MHVVAAHHSTKGAFVTNKQTPLDFAIGIAKRCDDCIGFHAKALMHLGATREEIEEVYVMSVYMGGDPSFMYAADALRAFDEFSE